jgi:phosphatidylinositol 4-kinase A
VALPFAVFTQSAMSAGIDAWTWLIAEKPANEIALMNEICAAWDSSISQDRGLFSKSMK